MFQTLNQVATQLSSLGLMEPFPEHLKIVEISKIKHATSWLVVRQSDVDQEHQNETRF